MACQKGGNIGGDTRKSIEESTNRDCRKLCFGIGSIKGKTERTLKPLDNATRAECAAILHRFIEANK